MKASEFVDFFEFSIYPIGKGDIDFNNDDCFNYANPESDKFYIVTDNQGCFRPRLIDNIEDLAECFDSMLNDYIDEDVEENGFINDENNTEKSYYEQMLDFMQTSEDYKDSGVMEIVACLVHPYLIEDDVQEMA